MSQSFNEDPVFIKVKRALLVSGTGGLKSAVRAFRAAQDSNSEVTSAAFAKLLASLGVPVSTKDLTFLAFAFCKDSKAENSPLDVNVIVRDLCLVNLRRLTAVRKAYDVLSNNGAAPVSASQLLVTHRGSAFSSTVRTVTEDAASNQLRQAFRGGSSDQAVSWEEFLAYYAGVSASIPLDHDFELAVLRSYDGADVAKAPRMGETARSWRQGTADSLKIQHDGLVKEALSPLFLQIEKVKLYDYTHAQRVAVPPPYLPIVNPDYITTTARSFPAYTPVERRSADPLLARTHGRIGSE